MRRPISSPFQSFREPYIFLLSQKPLLDLFVQIPKVPSCFLHLRNPYGRFLPLRLRIKPEPSARGHRFQKLFQSQQWDAQFLPLFKALGNPIFSSFRKNPFRICSSKFRRSHYGFSIWETRMVDFLFRLRVNPEPRFARYLSFRFGLNLSLVPTRFLVLTRCFLPVPSWLFPSRNPCFVYPSRIKPYLSFISRGIFQKCPIKVLMSSFPHLIHLDISSSHPG